MRPGRSRDIRFEELEPRHMLTFLAGDYDVSGVVDNNDFAVWKANFGQITDGPVDGNGDTIVDAADYTIWRDNLGRTTADLPPHASPAANPVET